MIKYTPTLTKGEYLKLSFFKELTKDDMVNTINKIKNELTTKKIDSLLKESKKYKNLNDAKDEVDALTKERKREEGKLDTKNKALNKIGNDKAKENNRIKNVVPIQEKLCKNASDLLNAENEKDKTEKEYNATEKEYNDVWKRTDCPAITDFVECFITCKGSILEEKKAYFDNSTSSPLEKIYNDDCHPVEQRAIKDYFIAKYTALRDDKPFKKLMADVVNIKVCLYCNINYTYAVDDGVSKRLLYQLDHFHSKDTYPWLALSFWNLIPSCSTCNASYKLTRALKIHPYANEISAPFSYKLNGVLNKEENIDVLFESKITDEQEDITTLGLVERYNKHKNVVVEFLEKKQKYADTQIEELLDFGEEKKLFENETEIKQLVFGYVPKDEFHNNSLAKFRYDILKELGIIT